MAHYKILAIIELLILLGIVGGLILYLLVNGSGIDGVSFITGR